jgi:hypothetical protein
MHQFPWTVGVEALRKMLKLDGKGALPRRQRRSSGRFAE